MRILIVATFFPPRNSIASLRPYSWAKWWSRAGHDVTVLTTTKKRNNNDFVMDVSDFTIIEIPVPILSIFSNIRSSYWQDISSSDNKKHFALWPFVKKLCLSFSRQTGCFYECRFPDFVDLWAKQAFGIIESLHFDMIISTGWPYSVHRIGLALKKKSPNMKWIIDWRDLWTKNYLFPGLRVFHWYERYLENKFHQYADLITTVSDPLADILRFMTKTRVETIYNGFDPEDYQEIKSKPRKENDAFTIVYTGSIYRGFRDPSPLFEAVENLKKKKLIAKNNLKIQFAGANADVGDIAEKYNISDFYSYMGFLPREDALQLQYDADAMLFLEYNKPGVQGILTGKLFEYLYIAKEIIAVGIDLTTTAGKLICDAQAGYCFGTDVEKIEEYLVKRVINKVRKTDKKDDNIIDVFSREKQAMKILDFLMN
jgi:glycosyltransferase involved in cell wall biosynthesis